MQGLLQRTGTTSDAKTKKSFSTKFFNEILGLTLKLDEVAAQNWHGRLLLLKEVCGYIQVIYYVFQEVHRSLKCQ